jgi:hypothetical protein
LSSLYESIVLFSFLLFFAHPVSRRKLAGLIKALEESLQKSICLVFGNLFEQFPQVLTRKARLRSLIPIDPAHRGAATFPHIKYAISEIETRNEKMRESRKI